MTTAAHHLPSAVTRTMLGGIAYDVTKGTEGDAGAVLIHLLAGVGAAVGAQVHCNWTGHHTAARLFALVVGPSGGGKGTSEGIAVRLLREALPEWTRTSVVGGLVSGEGLLAALAGEGGTELPGDDSRDAPTRGRSLLTIESEFARVLAACKREGSTLSPLLRDLWDKDMASSMSRQRPLRVVGANLSVVGHVTASDLHENVDKTMITNGFLNRFLPIDVQEAPLRPFGAERTEQSDACRVKAVDDIASAVRHGQSLGHLPLDRDAHELWERIYGPYRRPRPFLVGALLARGSAHVQRLALVLAIGDRDNRVRRAHIEAAVAIWERSASVWRALYGDRLGDPLAEKILEALVAADEAGTVVMSRSDIRKAVGSNNIPAAKIAAALELLRSAELAIRHSVQHDGGGRPAELWALATSPRREPAPGDLSLSSQSSHSSHAGVHLSDAA